MSVQRLSDVVELLKMNILYFNDRELWSPTISEMLEEADETETVSISAR